MTFCTTSWSLPTPLCEAKLGKNRQTVIGLEKPMKSIYYMLINDMLLNDNTISKEFPSRETNDREDVLYDSCLTPSQNYIYF